MIRIRIQCSARLGRIANSRPWTENSCSYWHVALRMTSGPHKPRSLNHGGAVQSCGRARANWSAVPSNRLKYPHLRCGAWGHRLTRRPLYVARTRLTWLLVPLPPDTSVLMRMTLWTTSRWRSTSIKLPVKSTTPWPSKWKPWISRCPKRKKLINRDTTKWNTKWKDFGKRVTLYPWIKRLMICKRLWMLVLLHQT